MNLSAADTPDREVHEDVAGKAHNLRSKPRSHEDEGKGNGYEFYNEGERLLLNLRCGLKNSYNGAQKHTN